MVLKKPPLNPKAFNADKAIKAQFSDLNKKFYTMNLIKSKKSIKIMEEGGSSSSDSDSEESSESLANSFKSSFENKVFKKSK